MQSAITGAIILYTKNICYLCQSFLDKLVEDAVLLPNVMPHHRLPVRIVLPVAAGHWANVPKKQCCHFDDSSFMECLRFLCRQISCYSVFEVNPCQMVLKVAVRVLCGGLELANRANLNRVLSRVSRNAKHGPVKCLTQCSQTRRFPVDVRSPVPVLVSGLRLPDLSRGT